MRRPSTLVEMLASHLKAQHVAAGSEPGAARHLKHMHETLLGRRLAWFRCLIVTPVLVAFTLAVSNQSSFVSSGCVSRTFGSLTAAILELLGSFYFAGLFVSVIAWVRHGPFVRFLMLRLTILGMAGAVGSISVAVALLDQRCAL